MSWTRLAATVSAATLSILVLGASGACATDHDFGRSGPYLGAGGVYAFENFSGRAQADSGSGGYNLRAGYRFNGYFALEAGWEQLISFDGPNEDTSMWMVGVSGKFFPFQGIIQPYLAAGAGWLGVDDKSPNGKDDDNLGFNFGLGLDVCITRNWAFNTEVGYLLPTGGISDYQAIPLSFGFLYRFY